MKYAIFDVDRTLIKNDSLLLSAWHANNKFYFFLNLFFFSRFLLLSKLGFISNKLLKEKFLKSFHICEFFNNHNIYKEHILFKESLKNNIRPEALKRIAYHKENGDKIFLAS